MASFSSIIENQGLQFLAEKILKILDTQSLANCRAASRGLRNFIDTTKSLILRQIQDANSQRFSILGNRELKESQQKLSKLNFTDNRKHFRHCLTQHAEGELIGHDLIQAKIGYFWIRQRYMNTVNCLLGGVTVSLSVQKL